MRSDDDSIYAITSDLTLTAAPACGEPSELEGVSRAELVAMLDNIAWFSRLAPGQRLAAANAYRRRARALCASSGRDGG